MSETRVDYQPRTCPPLQNWRLERRAGSGQFVVSEAHGTLLFRIDPISMIIWCWDKRSQTEVPIALNALLTLQTK